MITPSGWSRVELGQVIASTQLGGNYNGHVMETGIPMMKMGNMARGSFDTTVFECLHPDAKISPRDFLSTGDLILNTRNSLDLVGKVALWRGELRRAVFNSNMMRLVPDFAFIGTAAFLNYLLNSEAKIKQIRQRATGTTSVAAIYWRDLESLPLLLPTISEQRKIAEILGTWDTALEKLDALIAAKERHYSATLEVLLKKFSDMTCKVRDVAHETGARNRGVFVAQVLSVTSAHGFVRPEDYFDRQVASADVSNYKIVRKGEFAYNPSRINVGSIARLDEWSEGVVSPIYVVFALNERVNSDFFFHWLDSHEARSRIRRSAQGSVRDSVNFDDFSSIRMPLPDMEMQRSIARCLNAMQDELRFLRQQRTALDRQKRGLMQQLLTGKVRVAV